VNRIHTAGRLIAAAGIMGVGVLAFAAPAAAASGDSVTIASVSTLTITESQRLSIAATAGAFCHVGLTGREASLSLTGPTGPSPSTEMLKTSQDTACNQDISLTDSIKTPDRNGTYAVVLDDGHSGSTQATLNVLVPPAKAKGLAVTTAGTIAAFTWTANSEPDITGYQVMDSNGSVVDTVTPDSCSSGSCSANVDMGSSAAGHRVKFTVRAIRCGLACSDAIAGASSSSATADFAPGSTPTPTPTASPTPTPTKSSGGGSGGGKGNGTGGKGNGTGGSSTGKTGSKGKGAHLPSLSAAGVPALNAPALPGLQTEIKPLVLGKAGGKLAYPAPKVAAKKTVTGVRAISHDIASGLKLPPLWRGIAAAAVLLLIAVHLRAWATRTDLA